MNKAEIDTIIDNTFELAYMAGRWRGQVDLEKHMENDSYFDSFLGVVYDSKHSMPLHTVGGAEDFTKPVKYNLRSDNWRNGVTKSSLQDLEEAKEILKNKLYENI